jgi:hypothetical protein
VQGATMIKYNLIKSKLLTADKSPFVPKTIQEGNVSLEQAMKEIAYGSSTPENKRPDPYRIGALLFFA